MQPMESMGSAAPMPSSSSVSAAMAPHTFTSPSVRRSDSGVSLGLFSKIAAARKEKLTPFAGTPCAASSDVAPSSSRKGSTPPPMSSQFPDIHDTAVRAQNGHAREPSLSKKGVPPRGLVQTLRWTKMEDTKHTRFSVDHGRHSVFSSSAAVTSPPITQPMFPSTRGSPARLHTPERSRRSLYEIGRVESSDRILPLEQLVSRPATAGDETAFSGVRGFVRRPLEGGGVNNVGLPLQRRVSEWSIPPKPSTADGITRSASSRLVQCGQPEVLVLDDSTNKTPPEPVVAASVAEQEIVFADAADTSGVPIVYRHQKAKAANPERLNLDRRNLSVIPVLDGEHMLRLLNLQNNAIRKIDNLMGLPNLIFLDLYNNRIERLENLHVLPNLRVLMLGKNQLKRIENLDCLKKLDVIDLHSNEIERMENLNELPELRVLNLGGNKISVLEGIDKLHLLTELNLRRNNITSISAAIGRLASLQRLFLSNNKLDKLETLEPLLQVTSLVEIRLDNNPVCEMNQTEYRSRLIKSFPLLKHLDLRPLSDAERKEALLFYSQARAATKEREQLEETQRMRTIAYIRTLWEQRERIPKRDKDRTPVTGSSGSLGSVGRRTSASSSLRSGAAGDTATALSQNSPWGKPRSTASSSSSSSAAPVQDVGDDGEDPIPTSREDAIVYKDKTGYSEIQVHGDYRVLAIYGDAALEALASAKIHASIHAIQFRFVAIERVRGAANAPASSNLKLFARLRRLTFAYNDIESFQQLSWLAPMASKAEELFITHNGVCSRALFRNFVAARISNVARLNGKEITAAERHAGRQLFQKHATRVKPLDGSCRISSDGCESASTRAKDKELAPAKRQPSPIRQRPGVAYAVQDIVVAGSEMERKTAHLEDTWRTLLAMIAKETLQEISQHEGDYMAGCLDGL